MRFSQLQLAALSVSIMALTAASCAQGTDPPSTYQEPTPVSTTLPTPAAGIVSTPTVDPNPERTPTIAPSPTRVPASNPDFVSNADCANAGIFKEFFPIGQTQISVGETHFLVATEIADTRDERMQGLMCRSSLPGGTGMLFLFDEPSLGGFWMYNTYVPLDILFITAEDGIAGHAKMRPCPREQNEEDMDWVARCGREAEDYRPNEPYVAALELPEGWLEKTIGTVDVSEISVTFQMNNENGE